MMMMMMVMIIHHQFFLGNCHWAPNNKNGWKITVKVAIALWLYNYDFIDIPVIITSVLILCTDVIVYNPTLTLILSWQGIFYESPQVYRITPNLEASRVKCTPYTLQSNTYPGGLKGAYFSSIGRFQYNWNCNCVVFSWSQCIMPIIFPLSLC